MELLTIFLLGAIFLFTASLVMLGSMLWGKSKIAEKKAVKRRLLYLSAGGMHGKEKLSVIKMSVLQDAGLIARISLTFPRIASLDRLLLQSHAPFGAFGFFLLTFVLCGLGVTAGMQFIPYPALVWMPAVFLGLIPLMGMKISEQKTLRKIEEQLPEALDLMSRALRAGHALTTAIEFVAEEADDPIRSEFAVLVDEIRFGLTTHEVMDNLCRRVPIPDLRFFAITIALNKETGGNLTEIFDKIGQLVRERQVFRRQVEALTAEGRYSAVVLIFLPVAMFIYTYLTNYEYLSALWTDPTGRIMMSGAIIGMCFGYIVMRKMVQLDV